MTNEKQNNISERLDALEYLPGETPFDKDAAWENLHTRLGKKPGRNKAAWYWAAACLLPLLFLLWIMTGRKESTVVKTISKKQQDIATPIAISPLTPPKITASFPPAAVEKRPLAKTISKPPINTAAHKNITVNTENNILTNTSAAITSLPAAVADVTPPADALLQPGSLTIVKKKLRVVHINEMETTLPASPQLAVTAGHEPYNVKLRLGRSLNPPAADRQEYAGIVKIPLTN